ncbi:hypothetical protein [Bradyrhizobium sp. AUGA SZCCT0160]|uniref:hypothetical protein n=1 Tax=Bradyrhizobium sp. AUGA SZCCT0160 TaxID=2807662 RepID=UPI001BAD6853|nr:hypothetical protein [Bradyrhizobium sp. AUGA SZCCT0160]MBR1189571.1 hypothetical protein [Bradyrhizobium sp. AUGA SZCCT0160]
MLRRLARKCNLAASMRQNNPTGKLVPVFGNHVKSKNSENQKYFSFLRPQITGSFLAIPSHSEGVGRRHDEGRVAVDVTVAIDGRG